MSIGRSNQHHYFNRNAVGLGRQSLPKPVKISDLVDAIHSAVGVPVAPETETEPATRKTDWTRFALRSVFDVICCYVILTVLYRAVGEVALSR